ncbi:MAG: sulfate permease [Pseudomonadales bacterium]|nr:sulfate permease [Pseudomonadales bacterium]
MDLRDWQSYVPIIPVLKNYEQEDFSHDLIAGLVVGMVTIPQAVAYAYLAGVPPESGLYACLVPMLLYAVFGSSKQMVVGPVAVAALMVAATVSEHAPKYSDAYLGITTIICLQSGLFLWLLRLSRMGGLVNLLSHPVITGFVNAAAILIIISQLPTFVGIDVNNSQAPWLVLSDFLSQISGAHLLTVSFGIVALLVLLAFPTLILGLTKLLGIQLAAQHAATRIGPMVVAAISIPIVIAFDLQGEIDVVGAIPSGLPSITLPPFDATLWIELLPASTMVALVSYIESYSIGTTLAARRQTRVNAHQELIAIGAANIGAAFTGAYPVAGSFSRSSVNFYSGARTPISSVVCGVIIMFTLLFLTSLFEGLPVAVLAAIVMVSVVGLMDLKNGPNHWQLHREDTLTEYATMFLVLFMGVEVGLIAGAVLSIAFFVRTSSRPNITQVGRLANTEHFRSIKRYDVETLPHVLALRIDENIYFANATQIEDKCMKRSQRRRTTQHLLVVCSSVNMIDATGLQMLHRLNANLQRAGITMNFCDLKGTLLPRLQEAGLLDALTGQSFISADRAMKYFEQKAEEERETQQETPANDL